MKVEAFLVEIKAAIFFQVFYLLDSFVHLFEGIIQLVLRDVSLDRTPQGIEIILTEQIVFMVGFIFPLNFLLLRKGLEEFSWVP